MAIRKKRKFKFQFAVGIMQTRTVTVTAENYFDAAQMARQTLDRRANKKDQEAPVCWDLRLMSKVEV